MHSYSNYAGVHTWQGPPSGWIIVPPGGPFILTNNKARISSQCCQASQGVDSLSSREHPLGLYRRVQISIQNPDIPK